MLRSNCRDVLSERCQEGERQDRRSILSALSVADENLASLEVDILDPQLQRLEQAQATAVQQSAHDPVRAAQAAEQRPGFVAGEHDGQALGTFRVREIVEPRELPPQHDLVQEKQASQRLILRGRAEFPVGGEARKEGGDLGLAERLGMALVVKQDETANPTDVGLLGARAVVARPQTGPDAVEEARRPSIRRSGRGTGFRTREASFVRRLTGSGRGNGSTALDKELDANGGCRMAAGPLRAACRFDRRLVTHPGGLASMTSAPI